MDLDFEQKLKDLRMELFEFYHGIWNEISEYRDAAAPRCLKQLLDRRNTGVPIKVPADYFEFKFIEPVDVVGGVALGALAEIDWMQNVSKPEDIEARFSWVTEQEGATLEQNPDMMIDRKLCILKGRFMVVWSALVKLGIYHGGQDAEG